MSHGDDLATHHAVQLFNLSTDSQFCHFGPQFVTVSPPFGPLDSSAISKGLYEHFGGVKRQSGQPSDQRAVEADVLQVLADVDLDQVDELLHVP